MRRGRLAAACAALAAITVLGAGSAHAAVPAGFYGVAPQTPLGASDLDRMGQAQVGTLRFELSWARIDPSPAPGDYNWAASDAIVANAARNGIELLPFVYSTPAWAANGLDGHPCNAHECYPWAPQNDAARQAWQAFLADLAARYGPNGQFWSLNPQLPQQAITAWQIWNEQNSPSFFKPKPKVKAYAKLLAASKTGLRSVDPGADIVLGGMFGTPLGGRKPGISAWKFLRKLYDIKGAKKNFDAVAPHPYAAKLKKVKAQMDLLRKEMRKGRDRKTALWITELGWGSGGPDNPLNRGLKGQGQRLKQAYKFFKRKRKAWNVRTVVWYSWQDNLSINAGLCVWCPQSGLLTEGGDAKPSYRAFVKLTGGS
jgi:polysaccharide biosynthesis protein PslG